MRNLTTQQKKLLKEWFNKNYPHNTGYCKFNLADQIDGDTFEKIDLLNPTEVFYQNCNYYLEELVNKL